MARTWLKVYLFTAVPKLIEDAVAADAETVTSAELRIGFAGSTGVEVLIVAVPSGPTAVTIAVKPEGSPDASTVKIVAFELDHTGITPAGRLAGFPSTSV